MTYILLLVALGIVASVNAALGALWSASRIWLRHQSDGMGRARMVAALFLESPQRVTVAAGAAVAAAAFTTGALVADIGVERDAPPGWIVAVRVTAWAMTFVVFGQLVPRAIGRRWPMPVAVVMAPLIAALLELATPVRWIVTPLVAPFRRRATRGASDGDELAAVLREGELEGVGRKDELALISGVVQFADRTVGEVMTPRAEIFAISAAMAPTDAAERIAHAAYSRAPVYRETLDDIAGMILAFDVLKGDGISLPPLRPVADATTGERCNTLLSRMLAARRHFGVVRGPDGLVAGIVTLEDLIEELVGEIRDEHDDPPGRSGGLTGD